MAAPVTMNDSPKRSIFSSPIRHIRRLSRGGRVTPVSAPSRGSSTTSHHDDPGGVFVSTRSLLEPKGLEALGKSFRTASTYSESQTWSSCDRLDHHRGAPLIASSPESRKPIKDPAAELGLVLAKSRRLPSTSPFASNHVMVNNDRLKNMVAPLVRLRELDSIARAHAEAMAAAGKVFHMNPQDIRSRFCRASRRLGENVARGTSIQEIHQAMMKNLSDRNNILDRRFTNMGMATARGKDNGLLYLVQVFRG